MPLVDVLTGQHRQILEHWLQKLAQDSGPQHMTLRAVARNHDLEHRVSADTAQEYAQRVQELETCPKLAECGEACMCARKCVSTDAMLCKGLPCDWDAQELGIFLTQELLLSILRAQSEIDEDTIQAWGALSSPQQAATLANDIGVGIGHGIPHRRLDGVTHSIVWGVDLSKVDPDWSPDELRDHLGLAWDESSTLVATRYEPGVGGACCVPTVIDAMGNPRFQPSTPGLGWGMTRHSETNAPALPECVHRGMWVGTAHASQFYAPFDDSVEVTQPPREGYLESKLA